MIVKPTVSLAFSPAPTHVRTARLVGVAVARRAGVAEGLLDGIRLAISEACKRAVTLHRSNGLPDLVEVLIMDVDRFTVRVIDRAPSTSLVTPVLPDPSDFLADTDSDLSAAGDDGDSFAEEAMATHMGLAIISGLVEDLVVSVLPGGGGTEVRMSWPLGANNQHGAVA